MLRNLLRGYYRVIITSFVIVILSILALLFFQFNDKLEREQSLITLQIQENTQDLNILIHKSTSHLETMAALLSNRLNQLDDTPEHYLFPYFAKDFNGNGFSLDNLPQNVLNENTPNFISSLSLDSLTVTKQNQINTLLNFSPILSATYHTDKKVILSYFMGNQFQMIYPWQSSSLVSLNSKIFSGNNNYYRNLTKNSSYGNDKNNASVWWSEPYTNNADKSQVVSAVVPVYEKTKYFGSFILDINIASLDTVVTNLNDKPGAIYLVSDKHQIISQSQQSAKASLLTNDSPIFSRLVNLSPDTFHKIDTHYYYYENLENTSWKMVYAVSAMELYWVAFFDIGLYLVALLIIVFTIQVISFVFTQNRFVVPAQHFLEHIQYESSHKKNKRRESHKLPKGWSLWFHVITGIFEDNRSMLLDMQTANDNLEKKVHERTLELRKKQEEILVQNEELKQQQEEIEAQRDEIEQQKNAIVAKNSIMQRHNDSLLILVKSKSIQLGHWGKAMREITLQTAKELDISRVSIWQYDHSKQRIQCMNLYTKVDNTHADGGALYQEEYPVYFNEIDAERIIVANDVHSHPAMQELQNKYILPHGINSRLDVPFFIEGKLGGVLTCEHQGNMRHWLQEEVVFVQSVADIITISYKSMRRRIAEEKIKKQQNEIIARNVELKQKREEIENQTKVLQKSNRRLDLKNQELEQAFIQLKQTQSQLVHSEKMASLGILTAGIAHEINNPINYIKSGALGLKKAMNMIMKVVEEYNTLTVENTAEKLSSIEAYKNRIRFNMLITQAQKVTDNIELGVERTSELVKELRTFSRMDAAVFDRYQIHDGIESTLLLLTNQYKYNIKVVKNFGDVPLIECYPSKLNQVFMNLLTNATQAIEDEGTVTISTQYNPENERVLISVKDTGVGMAEDVQKKIFEPFFTTKEVGKGTGLGLAISISIIEEHSGLIGVNSTLGKGTEFTISLPVKQEKAQREAVLLSSE